MAGHPGYEPSVRSVLEHALPAGAHVLSGHAHLHLRVSYPLVVRTTGLGRLEGGELILTPASRVAEVIEKADELARTGVSGIVLAAPPAGDPPEHFRDHPIPIVILPEGANLQSVRESIDRYIVRRRRELFALEQRLHRLLVDAAIAGTPVERLIESAASETGALVWLDRGGEAVWRPDTSVPPDPGLRERALLALGRDGRGRATSDGPPRMLSLEVAGGAERRGIVAVAGGKDGRYEEDEAVLSALASAVSIALAREPTPEIPDVREMFGPTSIVFTLHVEHEETVWAALAVRAPDVATERLYRAITGDLGARSIPHLVARSAGALVVLAGGSEPGLRDALTASVRRSAPALEAGGLGRVYPGVRGAERTVRESLLALEHAESGVRRFEEVELTVVLASISGPAEFVRNRLSPLVDMGPAGRELLDTIRVYLASGRNAKDAAARLKVHRNTLLYRLRRVDQLLGLDWGNADAVFAVDLALRLLDLESAGLRRGGGIG